MDIKAYIESGVIDSYVLGIADAADVAELQRLSLEYPEIAAAIREREQWLQDMSAATARPVPADVKARILNTISKELKSPPVETKVSIHSIDRHMRLIAAAAVLAFIVSMAANVYLFTKFTKVNGDYLALQKRQYQILADNQTYQARLTAFDQDLRIMSQPGVVKVALAGVAGKENNLATVYWDTKGSDVYLIVNNLPQAPAGKQYQLWALVDGKPVDAGVISDCTSALCRLKQVTGAQTFAITLEKAGGSPSPTLDQMYVIGNVRS